MNTNLAIILAVGSYLVGAIPTGFLAVRLLRGEDIRTIGSGNIGATNVVRVMGRKWGFVIWFADALKGFAPCFIAGRLNQPQHNWGDYNLPPIVVICGLAAIIGHMFPVYLKFRGGKGVSTSCGVFLYLFPLGCVIGTTVWGVTLGITRYVSVSSILASLALVAAALVLPADPLGASAWLTGVCVLGAALVILRHHPNIKRLIAGTENKIGAKKSPPA